MADVDNYTINASNVAKGDRSAAVAIALRLIEARVSASTATSLADHLNQLPHYADCIEEAVKGKEK